MELWTKRDEVNGVLLLVAALVLGGAPSLELGNRASTAVAEEQHGAAVERRHPAELGAEALVVRVVPSMPALPRQRLDLAPHGRVGAPDGAPASRAHGLLGLQLDVELERLPKPPAARVAAPAAREPPAGEERGARERGRGGEVGQRGVGGGERGRGERGVEQGCERGGEQEGEREEHEQQDEDIERGGGRGVPARGGGGGRPRRQRGGHVAGPGPAGRGPGGRGRGEAHGREGGGAVVAGECPEHAGTGWGVNQSASAGRVKSGSDSLRALFISAACLTGWPLPLSLFLLG
jgi:hypothetical protein